MGELRVGRLTLHWWYIPVLLAAALTLLVALAGVLGMVTLHDFWLNAAFETYVSDAPGLTTINDPEGLHYVYEGVNNYFLRSGLDYRDALDLKIAYATEGTILRFALSDADLNRLLAKKQRIATSAVGEKGDWYLQKRPFTKLKWWPPSSTEAARMSVYEDNLAWDKDDFHRGTAKYRILADRPNCLVYIIGP